MKNLILTLIITLPLILWGQGWEQTFGGTKYDDGRSVQQTSDEGFIICGKTTSFDNGDFDSYGDVYLIKTDESGNEQWNKMFGGTEDDGSRSVQQTSDEGFIICGKTNSFGNGLYDVLLVKTDENGNEVWNNTFGGEYWESGYSVKQTSDGGYIICGRIYYYFGSYESDVLLIKTDENGIELWSQTFGGDGNDFGYSVQQTTDGGYIITGHIVDDIVLIKTDGNGNELWTKIFGHGKGYSVQQTTDGGFIITGFKSNIEEIGKGCLIKTDGNGNEIWTKTFGYGTDFFSVQQTSDGGYIMTGDTSLYDPTNLDVLLVKTDENGNVQWNKIFGGTDHDLGFYVQQTSDGGYILTGYTESFGNGDRDIYLIKTNQFGNITSTFEIPLPNHNRKLEKTVNLKGQEIKSQTNTPVIEIFDDGSVEKKLIIEK